MMSSVPDDSTTSDPERQQGATPDSGDEHPPINTVNIRNENEKVEILVTWDGEDDPENPQNWSTSFKSWVTFQLSMLAFAASLASSIIAPANETIAAYLGVSEEVVVLNVSLYV